MNQLNRQVPPKEKVMYVLNQSINKSNSLILIFKLSLILNISLLLFSGL